VEKKRRVGDREDDNDLDQVGHSLHRKAFKGLRWEKTTSEKSADLGKGLQRNTWEEGGKNAEHVVGSAKFRLNEGVTVRRSLLSSKFRERRRTCGGGGGKRRRN